MEENDISNRLKEVLKKEGLSWQTFNEQAGLSNRSTLRRNLLGWLNRANNTLATIGYEIQIKKRKKK